MKMVRTFRLEVIGLFAAMVILGGCATQPWGLGYDKMGRKYPEACRQDLSWVQADIKYVPRSQVPRVKPNEENLAMTYWRETPPRIVMANDIPITLQTDVMQHEKCHIVAGDWHK